MKEDFLIQIDSTQELDGEKEKITLSTRGNYARRSGNYYITYKESSATGFENCTTTLKIEGEDRVTMMRYGEYDTRMVVEPGQRSMFHYNTDAGSLLFGISAQNISNSLKKDGGEIVFSYSLDMNSQLISSNEVRVQVKPC